MNRGDWIVSIGVQGAGSDTWVTPSILIHPGEDLTIRAGHTGTIVGSVGSLTSFGRRVLFEVAGPDPRVVEPQEARLGDGG